jgi:hypothetical protein
MDDNKKKRVNNKRKGSNAERDYAKRFRELGFLRCITSREGSKLYDNSGIDLLYIPFNLQIKAGVQRGINYSQELKYVRDQINSNFDADEPVHKRPIILVHKKPKLEGKRERGEYDELVTMSWADFEKHVLPHFKPTTNATTSN